MLFGMWTGVGPRKHVLDGAAHWRNLVNTTELPICGGNAAFLPNYFDQLLLFSTLTFRSKMWRVLSNTQNLHNVQHRSHSSHSSMCPSVYLIKSGRSFDSAIWNDERAKSRIDCKTQNITKTFITLCANSRLRQPFFTTTVICLIGAHVIQYVSSTVYLGVTVNSNLSLHINKTCSKANKRANLILHCFKSKSLESSYLLLKSMLDPYCIVLFSRLEPLYLKRH